MLGNNIGQQIERFLRRTLKETGPSWIVTIERKGTALLRTIVEGSDNINVSWPGWDRVVSSKALPFVPPDYFKDGIVLLLDDGVHSGHRIQEAWHALTVSRGIPAERIRVAVFGVHERATFEPIHQRWFGQLSKDNYWAMRSSVIEFFRERGSLLLDTEHIEVPVHINCGRLEFFDALCRAGVGVEYASSGGQHNLTIHDPVILDEAGFVKCLPQGTLINKVIRKIRIIEREKNWYTIIPIFYPSVPKDSCPDSFSRLYPCFTGIIGEPELNFQLLSVFASIKLFQTAFACLRELINNGSVSVCVPKVNDPGDAIGHLKAIFPKIDLEQLHLEVEKSVELGRTWKPRKNELTRFTRIEAVDDTKHSATLKDLYWRLLQVALRYTDEGNFGKHQGASFGELIESLRVSSGFDTNDTEVRALLGTAVDMAIDEAQLVSDIKELPYVDGKPRITRVLRLDGEIVLSDVRRATAVWRFPYPPPVQWSSLSSCA